MLRQSAYEIHQQFLDRWSPRSMDGRPVTETEINTILEAARWAPSAYNYQPWKFLYALRGDEHWSSFLNTLVPANQSWVQNAGALVFVASDTLIEREGQVQPAYSHSFDAGAAWMSLALQVLHMDLCAHAMIGINFETARGVLRLPDRFRIECCVAIGHRASPDLLPDSLREREKPNDRKALSDSAIAGPFKS